MSKIGNFFKWLFTGSSDASNVWNSGGISGKNFLAGSRLNQVWNALWSGAGNVIDTASNALQDPETLNSLVNTYTNAGLTGRDKALNQLQLQNEHDKYQYQVSGMQDAGLNPALMYGGSGAGSTVPVPASSSAAPMDFGQLLNAISLKSQIKEMEANAKNAEAGAKKQAEETETEKVRRAKMQKEIDEISASIKEKLSKADLNDAERKNLEKALIWVDRLNAANINYLNSMSNLNDAQKRRIEELLENEKVIQSKTIDEFEHRWSMWAAQAAKDQALADLSKEDLANYAMNHMQNGILGSGFSFINFLRICLGLDKNYGLGFNPNPSPSADNKPPQASGR